MLIFAVNQDTDKPQLSSHILINDLAEHYPELIETLIIEYGFHCVGCFASQFETLEEGARVHGIEEEDFEEMMRELASRISVE